MFLHPKFNNEEFLLHFMIYFHGSFCGPKRIGTHPSRTGLNFNEAILELDKSQWEIAIQKSLILNEGKVHLLDCCSYIFFLKESGALGRKALIINLHCVLKRFW